jgi:hypothetical protein
MSVSFCPCPQCKRHVRAGEEACPFCRAPLPAGFGPAPRVAAPATGPFARAAILFMGAATTACSSNAAAPVPFYGPATVNMDASDEQDSAEPPPCRSTGPPPSIRASGRTPGSASTRATRAIPAKQRTRATPAIPASLRPCRSTGLPRSIRGTKSKARRSRARRRAVRARQRIRTSDLRRRRPSLLARFARERRGSVVSVSRSCPGACVLALPQGATRVSARWSRTPTRRPEAFSSQ